MRSPYQNSLCCNTFAKVKYTQSISFAFFPPLRYVFLHFCLCEIIGKKDTNARRNRILRQSQTDQGALVNQFTGVSLSGINFFRLGKKVFLPKPFPFFPAFFLTFEKASLSSFLRPPPMRGVVDNFFSFPPPPPSPHRGLGKQD